MLLTIPSHRGSIIDEGQLRPRRQLDDPSDDGESLNNFYFLTMIKKRIILLVDYLIKSYFLLWTNNVDVKVPESPPIGS